MIAKHLKYFFKSLSKFEWSILTINLIIGITLSILNIFLKNNEHFWMPYIALFATIFSIISCIFAAKKMILAFPTGIMGSCCMIPINYFSGLFGLMIMYAFNIVMQIILWIIWYRSSHNKISIEPKQTTWFVCIIYLVTLCLLTGILAYIETFSWFQSFWNKDNVNSTTINLTSIKIIKIIFDAAGLIFTMGVFYPLIKKYNQVWWLYLMIDCFSLIVWIINVCENPKNFTNWFMIINALSMTSLSLVSMKNWKVKQETK